MKIADLEQAGAFVGDETEQRTVKWNGSEHTVTVRRVSFGCIAATQAMPEGARNVELVRLCVRLGDDGKEQLTREQAEALDPALAVAFLNAIAEVNGLGKDATDPKG